MRDLQQALALAYSANAAGHFDYVEALLGDLGRAGRLPPQGWDLLALARLRSGAVSEAMTAAKRAVALAPREAGFHNTLGMIRQKIGDNAGAERAYRRAIALKAGVPIFHYNLGNALLAQDRAAEARAAYSGATDLDPNLAPAWLNAGRCHKLLEQPDEARSCYEQALAVRPDYAEALNNLATLEWHLGHHDTARALYLRTLEIRPDYTEVRYYLGTLDLAIGNYVQGWMGYEHRWAVPGGRTTRPAAALARPLWDGRQLNGERLLLWCEQGYGDSIQFVRLVPRLQQLGARIEIECPHALVRLFASIPGVEACYPTDEAPDDVAWHLPLGSLPRLLAWTPAHPSNVGPYLTSPPPSARQALPVQHQGGLSVGVVWGGKATPDPERSCPLATFRPLFGLPGVKFYSLQVGEHQKALSRLSGPRPYDLSSLIGDFADTAGLIEQMDLVITIDTALAHLVGAMGKPGWLLLPQRCGWPWGLIGNRTPWYPSLRLFRQERQGQWDTVIKSVVTALAERAAAQIVTEVG